MYTTKNGIHRNNTSTPPPVVCEPGHFIKKMVGARICRDWGEPLHIREMLRRCDIGTRENLLNHLTGYLENHSNLCYPMTYSEYQSDGMMLQYNRTLPPTPGTT